jgi:hypothetical protein
MALEGSRKSETVTPLLRYEFVAGTEWNGYPSRFWNNGA